MRLLFTFYEFSLSLFFSREPVIICFEGNQPFVQYLPWKALFLFCFQFFPLKKDLNFDLYQVKFSILCKNCVFYKRDSEMGGPKWPRSKKRGNRTIDPSIKKVISTPLSYGLNDLSIVEKSAAINRFDVYPFSVVNCDEEKTKTRKTLVLGHSWVKFDDLKAASILHSDFKQGLL